MLHWNQPGFFAFFLKHPYQGVSTGVMDHILHTHFKEGIAIGRRSLVGVKSQHTILLLPKNLVVGEACSEVPLIKKIRKIQTGSFLKDCLKIQTGGHAVGIDINEAPECFKKQIVIL